ncbi:prolyl oligopeptidase family serine peptidase [Flavobacterium sp. NRK1]|uniref:S9 family peptidase n=1 Tax=Flavobacterium sp. NRK1 TaxID=2954929 RepID=UPI00209273FA|nr:prolyl oligopeptidase family serine peptidase [Flavobacterium sp. NRK1]MCO6148959.1 prolyl oligopeptidase family serine peptidase [Flavobacterium sp. NRK1]
MMRSGKYICKIVLAVLIEMAATCFVLAQHETGKILKTEDFALWGSLRLGSLSDNGRYVIFSMEYPNGRDTLFVKDSKKNLLLSYPGGSDGRFLSNYYFSCLSPGGRLKITSLHDEGWFEISDVVKYDYSPKAALLIYSASEGDRYYLGIRNIRNGRVHKIWDAFSYNFNRESNSVVYSKADGKKNKLVYIHLGSDRYENSITEGNPADYDDISWQPGGSSLAFTCQPANGRGSVQLKRYNIQTRRLDTFDPDEVSGFPQGWQVAKGQGLKVSPDGERIFFSIIPKENPAHDPKQVQVWNAADSYLYPVRRRPDSGIKFSRLAVWRPEKNDFKWVTDTIFSEVALAGGGRYALLSDPEQYEPQWKYTAPRDYYILNLESGQRKIMTTALSPERNNITVSPGSWYVTYFQKGRWWLYDIHSGTTSTITDAINTDFTRDDTALTSGPIAWGMAGWLPDDKAFLFYDRYDVWMYDPKLRHVARLTRGREQQRVYRVENDGHGTGITRNYDGATAPLLSAGELLLRTTSRGRSGYCLYSLKTGCLFEISKARRIGRMQKAKESNCIAYTEEDYNTPAKLIITDGARKTDIFKSNPQHCNFLWGKSELIEYRNTTGKAMDAALYYPAGFKKGTRYPMIVYIYEDQSGRVHDYVNPGYGNSNGFNITNFTTKGYLVLVPDIAYQIGSPGYSAADCVTSAARHVIDLGYADSKAVGLLGHSFGGYETDFIITQTDMFAAAVAGAAIADLPSSYLYASANYLKPNFFHYEYSQLRMGSSLFDNFPGYLANSPVYHAQKVSTPLLSWTGENDAQVHRFQSMEFFLALRRVGKEHILLVYPEQGHALSGTAQQEDLSEKVEQWFGYYLKNEQQPSWIKPNRPR